MQGGQQRGPINGKDPLIYTGGLPNLVVMDREPTPKDYQGFFLGHWWIIPESANGSAPTEEIWVLVSKRNNIAKWKRLHGSSGPVSKVIIGNQILTTPGAGTYTPTSGMRQVYVECIGGGGGGFGYSNPNYGVAGGGSGYTAKLYTSDQIGDSQPFFIGSGGVAKDGSPPPGNNGEDTTFGASSTLITAQGGKSAEVTAGQINSPGGNGVGGDINIQGGYGESFTVGAVPGGVQATCKGGDSQYGKGGYAINDSGAPLGRAPTNGQLYGGGGGVTLQAWGFSGDGAQGVIKITEYFA